MNNSYRRRTWGRRRLQDVVCNRRVVIDNDNNPSGSVEVCFNQQNANSSKYAITIFIMLVTGGSERAHSGSGGCSCWTGGFPNISRTYGVLVARHQHIVAFWYGADCGTVAVAGALAVVDAVELTTEVMLSAKDESIRGSIANGQLVSQCDESRKERRQCRCVRLRNNHIRAFHNVPPLHGANRHTGSHPRVSSQRMFKRGFA